MTRILQLAALVVATIASSSMIAVAQPAAPAAQVSDSLSAADRDALASAEQLANQATQTLERWIATQAISEQRLFARLYFPVPGTDPQRFTTVWDALADRDLLGFEDAALARSAAFQYAIVTDSNAYVPSYNTRYAQPLTKNPALDYANNRSKRMYADPQSLQAARSQASYLIQRVRLETGEVIYDLSVPVTVRGKHWGCVRIGYRKAE